MKKIWIILLLMPLSSCTSNKQLDSVSTNDGVTTVTLNLQNINTYFDVVETGQRGMHRTYYSISFDGVLSFAVYESVVVSLNMHIYAEDGAPYYRAMNDDFSRDLILNAAGEGTSTLYYSDCTIDHVVDTGLGNDMLVYYELTWSIVDISGCVKYRL